MNKVTYSTRSALLVALLGAGTALVACGNGAGLNYPPDASDATTSAGAGGDFASTTSSSTAATTGSGGGTTGSGGGTTGSGGAMPMLAWVSELDATKGELPEGLVVNAAGDTAYVGYAPTGQIVKINLADGKVTPFGSVPPPPANKGFVLGLAFDKMGALYVAVASFDPAYQPGIYKLPAAGGAGTLFSSNAGLTFPNGLLFDATGDLFVTDSASGSIFKIDSAGVATKWLTDPLLLGSTSATCPSGLPFALGANGLAFSKGAYYVTNTDKATIIKVVVMGDGTAGAVSTFVAQDCANLGGPDGLVTDTDGSFIVAVNGINAITRVSADGKPTILVSKGKLESPATPWISGTTDKTLYVTNSAITNALQNKPAKPGLLKLPL